MSDSTMSSAVLPFRRAGWLRRTAHAFWAGDAKAGTRPVWYVCNQTPRPIRLEQGGRVFTLAALEERPWRGDAKETDPRQVFDLTRLIEQHQLEVVRRQPRATSDPAVAAAIRLWLILGVLWLASLWPLPVWWWLRLTGLLAVGAVLCFLVLLTRPGRYSEDARLERRRMARRGWNEAVMALVVTIGVLMPAAALYFATDLHEVVSIHPTGFSVDTGRPLVLIGRLLQLTFIAVATLLPALMYFQFDAERLTTLRSRWMRNVFRLDPTVSTVSDVMAKYGCQLDEAYGSREDQTGRLVRSRRSPIILATILLAFGWLVILLRAGDRIDPAAPGGTGLSFLDLLDPNPSLVTYAFLGAYFFGLQLIWQGYVRADLRPKTYTTVTVRVLVVVILAWLLDATLGTTQPANVLYLLAFLAGLVPNTVLHFIAEKVLGQLGGTFNRDQMQQLTVLDGIDLYERTRLSEEGITSVEALAHHDLLDLFFKTRLAAARLIDWVDQAILTMYLGTEAGGPGVPSAARLRAGLRAVGIRTATDLVEATGRRGSPPDGTQGRTIDSVATAVAAGVPDCTASALAARLCLISTGIDRSEWVGRIRYWRRSDLVEADQRHCYLDGNGDLHRADPGPDSPGPDSPGPDSAGPGPLSAIAPRQPQAR